MKNNIDKRSVLVVGGDSFLGQSLAKVLRTQGHSVFTSTRRTNKHAPDSIYLDLNTPVLKETFDHVILLAGIWNYHACATDPNAYTVNVTNMLKLANDSWKRGSFVTFVSTNTVFGGDRPWCNEHEATTPKFPYAQHKAEAEEKLSNAAAEKNLSSLFNIIRLTKLLDTSVSPIPDWINTLEQNLPITPFEDLIFAPMSRRFAAQHVAEIALSGHSGIFHLSGSDNINYLDFAKQLANALDFKCAQIEATTSIAKGVNIPFLPKYSGLGMQTTSKEFAIAPQPVSNLLDDLKAEYKTEQKK